MSSLSIGDLGTTAATGSTTSSANLAGKVASSILATCTTTATARSTAAGAKVTSKAGSLGSSWLDNNVLAVNGEVLASQSGLVALNSLVLHKGTVLNTRKSVKHIPACPIVVLGK